VLKTIFNRARPLQIDTGLHVQHSISANTPAFPAGHSIQAYYLAKYLSKIYPERTQKLYRLAEDCALARVYAGLHYPSDNQFGKYIGLHII
jgi:membrane-associated phospholipid phosphatase